MSFLLFQTVRVLKSRTRILMAIKPRDFFAWKIEPKDNKANIKKAGILFRVYFVVEAIIAAKIELD